MAPASKVFAIFAALLAAVLVAAAGGAAGAVGAAGALRPPKYAPEAPPGSGRGVAPVQPAAADRIVVGSGSVANPAGAKPSAARLGTGVQAQSGRGASAAAKGSTGQGARRAASTLRSQAFL